MPVVVDSFATVWDFDFANWTSLELLSNNMSPNLSGEFVLSILKRMYQDGRDTYLCRGLLFRVFINIRLPFVWEIKVDICAVSNHMLESNLHNA